MASTVVLRVLRKLFSSNSFICSMGSIGVKVSVSESNPESYVALSLYCQSTRAISHLCTYDMIRAGQVMKSVRKYRWAIRSGTMVLGTEGLPDSWTSQLITCNFAPRH